MAATSGYRPGHSLDAPGRAFGSRESLGFTDFANAHLRSASACHLEDMAVGRRHLKDAVLVTQNFGRIHDFDCAVNRLDHCAPRFEILRCRDRH
jgi:hypothetical protein